MRILFKPANASQSDEAVDASSEKTEGLCAEDKQKLNLGFGKRKHRLEKKPIDQNNDARKQKENRDNVKYTKLFSAKAIGNPPGKKSQDERLHEVIIPYHRFETERFYFSPYPSPKSASASTMTAETVNLLKKKDI